jgi:hypothetical protein
VRVLESQCAKDICLLKGCHFINLAQNFLNTWATKKASALFRVLAWMIVFEKGLAFAFR